MKKISTILSIALFVLLASCTDSKQITNLQDQARRLESQIQKEHQENTELSSYRFSMESQFKRKNEDYLKCQEDGKENLKSLTQKYSNLESDYEKLQGAYKSLNEANDASKEMSARMIVDLEERIEQIQSVEVSKKITARPSKNSRIKIRKKRKKR